MVLETDIAKNMIEVDECTPRKKNRLLNISEGAMKGPILYTACGSRS